MKRYIIGVFALTLASCAGDGGKTEGSVSTDSAKHDTALATNVNTPAQNMEYCFVRTDGTSAQDTTAIHLVINAGKVSGDMDWIPKQKDSRKGTLLGTLDGDIIKAVWSFTQEGMKDTLAVAFRLSAQQLAQKPFKVNSANGRQQLDVRAGYTLVYNIDNCKPKVQ